ncbi:MAG: RDD family protein [Pseudomonadota bacterium]|nr:RDD family protein [Pseudomonadota bacterium]
MPVDQASALSLPKVRLLRRFAAIFYDSLILFLTLYVATVLIFPFTHGEISLGYRLYLLSICFLYFALSWRYRGQTAGMLAWGLHIHSLKAQSLTWQQIFIRFMTAIISWLVLGLGFFWALGDKQGRTWHDWLSATQLVYKRR